jgi:hypothetical protein
MRHDGLEELPCASDVHPPKLDTTKKTFKPRPGWAAVPWVTFFD